MAVASTMLVLWYEETLLKTVPWLGRGGNLSYYMSVISNWLFTKIFKSLSGLSVVKGNFN